MTEHRRLPLVAAALAFCVALAGCADTGPVNEDGAGGAAARPAASAYFADVHRAAEHMEVWGRLLAIGIGEHAELAGDPASDAAALLAELDFLLRGHTVYVAYATERAVDEGQGPLTAATDTVGTTTTALTGRLRELLGEEAAERFEELWSSHVDQEIRYAQAVGVGDQAARERAREELAAINEELTGLLMDHLGQLVERGTVEQALRAHVEDTIAVIEAQHGGNPWFRPLREGVDHMATVAEQLAPPLSQVARLSGDATTPAAKLYAELSGRMAETVWFTAPLTRLVIAGDEQPELREAARRLLDENTGELEEVLRRGLGQEPAERLGELWSRHNELFVRAAEAAGAGGGSLSAVEDSLKNEFTEPIGRVLEQATGGALQAGAMRSEAATHVETMIGVIEAQAG